MTQPRRGCIFIALGVRIHNDPEGVEHKQMLQSMYDSTKNEI
jgi:hypothetical protein